MDDFDKLFVQMDNETVADLMLGTFCYRFNRRFNLEEMTARILQVTCNCTARPERLLGSAELTT
jgi:hypothetical protein